MAKTQEAPAFRRGRNVTDQDILDVFAATRSKDRFGYMVEVDRNLLAQAEVRADAAGWKLPSLQLPTEADAKDAGGNVLVNNAGEPQNYAVVHVDAVRANSSAVRRWKRLAV